jgi:hypothetical protein
LFTTKNKFKGTKLVKLVKQERREKRKSRPEKNLANSKEKFKD